MPSRIREVGDLTELAPANRAVTSGEGALAGTSSRADTVWLPGGVFRMGSDQHYPEEQPVHRVRVDGFWIDRTPVNNHEFRRFVEATGYVTFAGIAPDPKDCPGALPHIIETSISTSWETIARGGAIAVTRTFLEHFLDRDVNEIRERQPPARHEAGR